MPKPSRERPKALRLSTYRIGSPRGDGEGLRVGAVRFLPRGVKAEDYARKDYFDVWLPGVAPEANLIAWWREKPAIPSRWKRFGARYGAFLRKDTNARQTVELLARVSDRTPVSIGCYCEDEARCHRSLLFESIDRHRRSS